MLLLPNLSSWVQESRRSYRNCPFSRSIFSSYLSDEGNKHYRISPGLRNILAKLALRIPYRAVVTQRKPWSNIWASVCEAHRLISSTVEQPMLVVDFQTIWEK